MKKFNFKKVGIPIILIIAIVLSSIIAVWSMKKTDNVKPKDETTVESGAPADGSFHYDESTEATTEEGVTEVSVETTILENGEVETRLVNVPVKAPVSNTNKETEKANDEITTTTEKKDDYTNPVTHGYTKPETRPVVIYTTKPSGDNTVPVPTTRKPVTTTKKPVETQVIKETTTKAPETTKKPTTTQAEYYPALTQADIEEIKQYTINYIQSKGQRVRSTLTWDNAGYSSIFTVPTDLSNAGEFFKRNGGVDPVEWAKGQMKDSVDYHIEDWERQNGEGSIGGLYPLIKCERGYWNFTLGYC